jgi:hypothetical protein
MPDVGPQAWERPNPHRRRVSGPLRRNRCRGYVGSSLAFGRIPFEFYDQWEFRLTSGNDRKGTRGGYRMITYDP